MIASTQYTSALVNFEIVKGFQCFVRELAYYITIANHFIPFLEVAEPYFRSHNTAETVYQVDFKLLKSEL